MKRFLLFGGSIYYAAGGWKDFVGSFDREHDARRAAEQRHALDARGEFEWYHVVDRNKGEIVLQYIDARQ